MVSPSIAPWSARAKPDIPSNWNERAVVPSVLQQLSGRDKSGHDWGQGEAGVTNLIHVLTEPDELILDPFAGSALWGRIAMQAGRQ
jgi:hypothetical protein